VSTGWVLAKALSEQAIRKPAGTLVFSGAYFYAPGGVEVGQAEMRATLPTDKFMFPATRTGGDNTGVAIVNPLPASIELSCKIFDEDGAVVANLNRTVPPYVQVRGFIDEIVDLPSSWTRGKGECSATDQVVAMVLKTKNVNGAFTFSSGVVTPLD
jgi:hypothetical protein